MNTKYIDIECSPYMLDGSLANAVATLQKQLTAIPLAYRDSATISIDAHMEYDDPTASINISYTRPKTEKEISDEASFEKLNRERERDRLLKRLAVLNGEVK